MSVSKTIQIPYISGVSTLTINVLTSDGLTVLQSGIALAETAMNSMTYDGLMTAVVTLGTYRINVLRSGAEIAQFFCDLSETVGLYPVYDGPTPIQIATGQGTPTIQNNVYVTVTSEMGQAAQEPNLIQCKRGDTLLKTLPALGSITGWEKVYFTAKQYGADADLAAMIQMVAISGGGGGLITLLGSQAIDPADAVVTVIDATVGTVSISLIAADTALFPIQKWFWDARIVYANGAVTTPITNGFFNVTLNITQAIS